MRHKKAGEIGKALIAVTVVVLLTVNVHAITRSGEFWNETCQLSGDRQLCTITIHTRDAVGVMWNYNAPIWQTTNWNGELYIYTGVQDNSDPPYSYPDVRRYGLWKFNLTPIHEKRDKSIQSSALRFRIQYDNTVDRGKTYNVYRIPSSWDESTVTYNTQPPLGSYIDSHSFTIATYLTFEGSNLESYVGEALDNSLDFISFETRYESDAETDRYLRLYNDETAPTANTLDITYYTTGGDSTIYNTGTGDVTKLLQDSDITITAACSDVDGINSMKATLQNPVGSQANLTMTHTTGDQYQVNFTATELGTYNITRFWCEDSFGHQTTQTSTLNFTSTYCFGATCSQYTDWTYLDLGLITFAVRDDNGNGLYDQICCSGLVCETTAL